MNMNTPHGQQLQGQERPLEHPPLSPQTVTVGETYATSTGRQAPALPPPSQVGTFVQPRNDDRQRQYAVAVGNSVPPPNIPVQLQATPAAGSLNNLGGTSRHFPQAPIGPPSVSQCKLPGCREPRYFDNRIQEQLDYCRYHINTAISEGFAALCERCKELPARDDSRYCSQLCRSAEARGPSVARQLSIASGTVPQGFAATCQECHRPMGDSSRRFCSLQCENANRGHQLSIASGTVPQGFAATCQECRRPMADSNRRFCSLQCENANRGHSSHR